MRWAGANPDIFPDYIQDFNSNEYQLLMNHRSVPKLVEFQKEVHQILIVITVLFRQIIIQNFKRVK